MWPPNDVVRYHKRRARFIWASLLALITGYSIWLLVITYEKRKNPTVSLRLEEDRYAFPTISICVFASNGVGYGCDSENITCAQSLIVRTFNLFGFEDSDDDWKYPTLNEAYPTSCVDLDLSDITEDDDYSGLFPPSMTIQAVWDVNGGEETSVFESSEGALVFFTDPDISDPLGDHYTSSFIGAIPFTRQGEDETYYTFEEVEIAMTLTENLKLDGTKTKTYGVGSISSRSYEILEELDAPSYEQGILLLNVVQPSLTDTIREEINPLQWTELLGNIGGTWELVLILWGIFFVAIHNEPRYKGRDLVQAAREGAQKVVKGATSIASTVCTRRDSGTLSLSESKQEVEVVPVLDSRSGIASERLRSTNQNHPHPPPAYDFSEDQIQTTSAVPNRTGGGRHTQVASGVRKPSGDGIDHAPSRNIPVVDDMPRPGWRPL